MLQKELHERLRSEMRTTPRPRRILHAHARSRTPHPSSDWNAVRLRPPVAPWVPLKINLGDVFHIHTVHVRRHLRQIERVLADPETGSSADTPVTNFGTYR